MPITRRQSVAKLSPIHPAVTELFEKIEREPSLLLTTEYEFLSTFIVRMEQEQRRLLQAKNAKEDSSDSVGRPLQPAKGSRIPTSRKSLAPTMLTAPPPVEEPSADAALAPAASPPPLVAAPLPAPPPPAPLAPSPPAAAATPASMLTGTAMEACSGGEGAIGGSTPLLSAPRSRVRHDAGLAARQPDGLSSVRATNSVPRLARHDSADDSPLGSPPRSLPRAAVRRLTGASVFSDSSCASSGAAPSPPRSVGSALLRRSSVGSAFLDHLASAGGRRDSGALSPGASSVYRSCDDAGTPDELPSPPKSLSHAAHRNRLSHGGSRLSLPPDEDASTSDSTPAAEAPAARTPGRHGLRLTPARQQRGGPAAAAAGGDETPRSARKSARKGDDVDGTGARGATLQEQPANTTAAALAAAAPAIAAPPSAAAEAPSAAPVAMPKTPRSALKGARTAAAIVPANAPAPSMLPLFKLDKFPATFQQGTAAEQLRLLHATLLHAAAPLSVRELREAIPTKLETERINLLLEVMVSRHVVGVQGHGERRRFELSE